VLARRLFQAATPVRGRFRSLLLRALENYLRQEHRRTAAGRESRSKRRGRKPGSSTNGGAGRPGQEVVARVLSMDPRELAEAEPDRAPTPHAAFTAQWSAMLVRRVLEQVRESCRATGLEQHWTIFELRVARPMLLGEQPAPYAELVARLGLEDASQAANMMITVKRRVARALYQEVLSTVASPEDAEGELRGLLCDLEATSC
jgi:hypothetical protein